MTAWEELDREGDVGRACYALFVDRARRESGRFPPPNGHTTWTDDDIEDLVQDVFSRGGRKIAVKLIACPNQDTLEATVTTIVQNRLRDDAKSTEVGKLRRRLVGLLADDERFQEPVQNRWSLRSGPTNPTELDRDALDRAAFGPDVRLDLPLNKSGPTSEANVAALTAVCAAVLGAANGSVGVQDLAHAVAARCHLAVAAPVPLEDSMTDRSSSRSEDPDVQLVAVEIAMRLTDVERREFVRGAGVRVPRTVGRRQQQAIRDRLAVILSEVVDDDFQEKVAAEMVMLLSPRPDPPSTITSSDPDEVARATQSSGEVTP